MSEGVKPAGKGVKRRAAKGVKLCAEACEVQKALIIAGKCVLLAEKCAFLAKLLIGNMVFFAAFWFC